MSRTKETWIVVVTDATDYSVTTRYYGLYDGEGEAGDSDEFLHTSHSWCIKLEEPKPVFKEPPVRKMVDKRIVVETSRREHQNSAK